MASVNMTAFDALRVTIYSEVATLISQIETNPHYLIELFRQHQLISTDFLRQRALYAIQDLCTRYSNAVGCLIVNVILIRRFDLFVSFAYLSISLLQIEFVM